VTRLLRLVAALLVAMGLVAGFAVPRPTPRPSLERGGFFLLAGDFHVHSFPGDGSLAPWDIAREAARRGLDVVALTNHNSMLSSRLAGYFVSSSGALLIPSEEITGVGFHLAAVGIDRTIDWRGPVAAAAAAVHARGGVLIAAHPGARYQPAYDAAAVAGLDGVEAAHPMIHVDENAKKELAAFYQRVSREHPGIAAIGSSDYHNFAPVGLARTFLFAKSRAREGVLDAIRAGRTVACDGRGQTYGPADLAALVADDCRRAATAPPLGAGLADSMTTWLVWLGLIGLVVAGFE
jgi:hypothetical protein